MIPTWSTTTEPKIYSEKFEIGTYIWCALAFFVRLRSRATCDRA